MEDSTTIDDTLRLYRELREAGYDNVGVVLQSSLHRTLDDIAALADLKPWVRICKGIYVEPDEIQFHDFEAVRANFVRALEALFETGARAAIATHDEWLVEEAKRLIAEHGLDREDYEFQMLLGVRSDLGDALVDEGRRLRIYVPFGAQWYRVLAAAAAGESEHRRLHRARRGRTAAASSPERRGGMKRVTLALIAAAFVLGGCADPGAHAPPSQQHYKPSSNQNPDTEAR